MQQTMFNWKPKKQTEVLVISRNELPVGWYESADPRPDLAYDSKDWVRFLDLAEKTDPFMAGALHGFRCCGLRLHRGGKGWALRPELDPTLSDWETVENYLSDRDKWLSPYRAEIVQLLEKL